MRRKLILVLFIVFVLLVQRLPLYAQEDTLFGVLEKVRMNHPQLKQEKAALEAVRAQMLQARAAYLPTVNLQASLGRSDREGEFSGGSQFVESISPQSAAVEINQLLFNGGRRSFDLHISALSVKAAEARVQELDNRISREAVDAYLDLELNSRALKIRQDIVTLFEKQLGNAKIRQRAGQAAQPEIDQIEARLAEVKAELIAARLSADVARSVLVSLTGSPITEIENAPLLELPTADIDEMIETSLHVNPTLQSLRQDRDIATIALRRADRERWPTVSLVGRASKAEENSATLDRDEELSVAVNFSMPLYAGGLVKAGRKEAVAAQRQARYSLQDAERQVRLEIMQAWASRASGESSLVARQRRLAYEEEALAGLEKGRAAGVNSTTEILIALENVLEANLSLLKAEMSLKQSAALLRLLGQDLEKM